MKLIHLEVRIDDDTNEIISSKLSSSDNVVKNNKDLLFVITSFNLSVNEYNLLGSLTTYNEEILNKWFSDKFELYVQDYVHMYEKEYKVRYMSTLCTTEWLPQVFIKNEYFYPTRRKTSPFRGRI